MCHLQLNLKWFANCHLAPWIKGLWRICTFQIKQRIHLKQNPSLKFSMPQKKLFHRLLPIRERRASVCLSSSSGDFLDNNAMKCVREGDRKTSSVICGSWGKISPQRISQPWKRERREGEREREREREREANQRNTKSGRIELTALQTFALLWKRLWMSPKQKYHSRCTSRSVSVSILSNKFFFF